MGVPSEPPLVIAVVSRPLEEQQNVSISGHAPPGMKAEDRFGPLEEPRVQVAAGLGTLGLTPNWLFHPGNFLALFGNW